MNTDTQISAWGILPDEWKPVCEALGLPGYRAQQINVALHRNLATRWDEVTTLSRELRAVLSAKFTLEPLAPALTRRSTDGVTKLLLECSDGERIETVLIPSKGRVTQCISTQAGCAFGCAFCASGMKGLARNLTAAEIVAQVVSACRLMRDDPTLAPASGTAATPPRPGNIVVMGIGEPFANYDNVIRALRILNDQRGINIGARHITISTCGVVPGIRKLAQEGLQFELSVSLHAPDDTLRRRLMPVNDQWPVRELIDACDRYTETTGRIITYEYTLIRDFNDRPEHAQQLINLLKNHRCKVNLIPLSPVEGFDGQPPDHERCLRFLDALHKAHLSVTMRKSRGKDVDAACGQLRLTPPAPSCPPQPDGRRRKPLTPMNAKRHNSQTPPSPASEPERVSVTGTVESIIYRNDESGYTVCSVKAPAKFGQREEIVTLVGTCAALWEGEELHAEGSWQRHPSHGRQFHADTITCIAPTSTEGIRRYLASGMIKGIGPTYAAKIVERFGLDTLRIIDRESARLEEINGIGRGRRAKIKESWSEQQGVREIMIFLQSYGIGTAKSSRIYRQYGADAIAIVKRNPYRLCEDVWGIGFKTADKIALNVGIPHDSELRARAGLIHTLRSEADDGGHCYAFDADLMLHAQSLLDISVEKLGDALNAEIERGTVVREQNRIYSADIFRAETRSAAKLNVLLNSASSFPPIDAGRAVEWAEKKMGITLAAGQLQALRNALSRKVSIITGGPGVGKTTIIRALTDIFHARKLTIHLAAPTGRAAKRMSEATGSEAATIHRLLKFNPSRHAFDHNAENPIKGDCFILDETSMVDIRLIDHFLQALPAHATLIMVGDIDQLPSVGPGNVLRDLIDSNAIPYCRLETIYRQDTRGQIVRNAHRINSGEGFLPREPESDFYFIETEEPPAIIERTVEMMTRRIPQKFRFDPLVDVQVLTPMRRNLLGAENLNDVLQAALNPSGPALQRGGASYRQGDRVMQMRNNYDKEVFNGDIGFIKQVDAAERTLVVLFDGRPVAYEQSELDELVLAYATSIHKSQGSEYPAVIILLHTQHYKLLQRNLLYTAVTRGKQLVIVIGSSRAVAIAIKANQVRERRTTLKERLL